MDLRLRPYKGKNARNWANGYGILCHPGRDIQLGDVPASGPMVAARGTSTISASVPQQYQDGTVLHLTTKECWQSRMAAIRYGSARRSRSDTRRCCTVAP